MNSKPTDWGGSFLALAFFSLPVVVLTGFITLVIINVLEAIPK